MVRLARENARQPDCFAGFHLKSDKSQLTAHVLASKPDWVYWTIHLEWHDKQAEERSLSDSWGMITDLVFHEKNWRDLAGKETHVSYDSLDVYPVNPGNPSNFCWAGEHDVLNQNHIYITGRDGRIFSLHWRCRLGPEPSVPLDIVETVAYETFAVYFPDYLAVDLETAQAIANRHFAPGDLEKPASSGKWVRFKVRADLK